jgi:hypothetical protein
MKASKMMDRLSILQTAIGKWDEESGCFIVQSPLCDKVIGAAPDPGEAVKLFIEILDDTITLEKEGKLANPAKRGRPKRNKVQMHIEIEPEVKNMLSMLADKMNISQGDVVEYLAARVLAMENTASIPDKSAEILYFHNPVRHTHPNIMDVNPFEMALN